MISLSEKHLPGVIFPILEIFGDLRGRFLRLASGRCAYQKLVECDRQSTDSLSGCMEHGVSYCRRCPDDTKLTQTFDAEWVDDGIPFLDEEHVDIMHVCVDGDVVLRQIVIHETSELLVYHALLLEGHADAPDDSTHDLTSRRFRIEDAAACNGGNDTRDLNCSQVLVNFHFRKYR